MYHVFKRLLAIGILFASWASCASAEQFDPSFNGTGRSLEIGSGPNRSPIALLERPDGRLVQISYAVGTSCGPMYACPRLTYFNQAGQPTIAYDPLGFDFEFLSAAAIDSQGRLILVGTSGLPSPTGRNFRVMRLLITNGPALDSSFGTNGAIDINFFGNNDYANAVAIDADDNILVVGEVGRTAPDTDFGIAKILASNGTLDTGFGVGGKRTIAFDLSSPERDSARAVAISPSGDRITIVGNAYDSAISGYKVAMTRLTRNGIMDTTLCPGSCTIQGNYAAWNSGRRVYYFGANTAHQDFAYDLAVLGSGDFFVVGVTDSIDGMTERAAIARFYANGDYYAETLNSGLGTQAGYNTVQVSDATGERVLVGGGSGPFGNSNLVLQAFNPDLTLMTGYGDCLNTTAICFHGGPGTTDYEDRAEQLTLDHLGRPLFAGVVVPSIGSWGSAMFARFTNDTGPKPDRIFRNGFQ